MLKTTLCHRLGIEHPIFSAGMGGGMAGPALVTAVSNAGGCGVLGMGGLPAAYIREQIRETRALTRQPFGVNLLLPSLQPGQIEVCLEEEVPILVLFWGDCTPYVRDAHARGVRLIVQVGSVDEAQEAARAGADAIIAQGLEAGGHVKGTTALSVIVPAVVAAVQPIPVIASGGIANGRGLVAALSLGAQAVSMGTRFLASNEARAMDAYKTRIVQGSAEDTVHTLLFDVGWPDAAHRVLRNRAVREWEAAGRPTSGQRPGEGSVVGTIPLAGVAMPMLRYMALPPLSGFTGDIEETALYAGESCSLVHDLKPAGQIVRHVMREAEAVLAELRTGS